MQKIYRIGYVGRIFSLVLLFIACSVGTPKEARVLAATVKGSTSKADNGVEGLRETYRLIQTYRLLHSGVYPTSSTVLLIDATKNLKQYGFATLGEEHKAFNSPDNKFAEEGTISRMYPETTDPFIVTSTRPDGQPVGSATFRGEEDIIGLTNLYYYQNVTYLKKKGGPISNPSGYILVLRSNGDIEGIPYDEKYLVPMNQTDFQDAFPGQPGVPWNCITYAEFYTGYGASVLIGKPTVKGNEVLTPDNGGPETLITFSRLFNFPDVYGINRAKMWQILSPAQEEFSFDNIKDAATNLGLPVQKETITLDELQKLHTPAMLYLSDAERIVTMSTTDDDHAIILDRGMTLIVSRAELAKRYGGEALIGASVNAPSSVQVDQPIRMLNFSSKDAEVTQNVKITNHGAKPVSLLIERPLCGITEAKLSQDNLVPGASVNLELHFKWRTVLPGDHQSTFVTLKTNDPAQPRLQLGFDLKLTEAK